MVTPPNELIRKLRDAKSVICATGAGVSAESGIPTFRGAQTGFWQQYDPQQLASPEGFRRNPKLVWDWYAWRRQLVARTSPNPGHLALAELQDLHFEVTVVTQNIDGLHQRAGSRDVIDLHGSLARVKCSADHQPVDHWEDPEDEPPRCPDCGAYLRPDVVWFGEGLSPIILQKALELSRQCDVFFSIGTSSLIHPAASLPYEALSAGATLVEINPEPTPLSNEAHYVLRGPSGEILPVLLEHLRCHLKHSPPNPHA